METATALRDCSDNLRAMADLDNYSVRESSDLLAKTYPARPERNYEEAPSNVEGGFSSMITGLVASYKKLQAVREKAIANRERARAARLRTNRAYDDFIAAAKECLQQISDTKEEVPCFNELEASLNSLTSEWLPIEEQEGITVSELVAAEAGVATWGHEMASHLWRHPVRSDWSIEQCWPDDGLEINDFETAEIPYADLYYNHASAMTWRSGELLGLGWGRSRSSCGNDGDQGFWLQGQIDCFHDRVSLVAIGRDSSTDCADSTLSGTA